MKEARERLTARFEVEARVQQLATGLRRAELIVEILHESVQHVHQTLEMGVELDLSLNADAVAPLLEEIADIDDDLSYAVDSPESLGQLIGEHADDDSRGFSLERVAAIAARLVTTFRKADSRLASFRVRSADAQNACRQFNATTHARLVAVAVGTTFLLVWMAAGQLCLWRRGL
jgi:hypothetical protein